MFKLQKGFSKYFDLGGGFLGRQFAQLPLDLPVQKSGPVSRERVFLLRSAYEVPKRVRELFEEGGGVRKSTRKGRWTVK